MAKEKVEQTRTKKAKTPAQLAKKAENERKAAERLVKLQADAALVKELRAKGYIGSDYSILQKQKEEKLGATKAQLEANKAAAKAKEEADHQVYLAKKTAEQKKYVEECLDGPSGEKYRQWLKDQPATFKNCQTFLKKTGLPRTHKDAVIPEDKPPQAVEVRGKKVVATTTLETVAVPDVLLPRPIKLDLPVQSA